MTFEESINNKVIVPPPPANKESPLTDIATSPPPFEFPSNMRVSDDGDDDDDEIDVKSDQMQSRDRDPNDKDTNRKDSYESSELSDLGEDDSEAETDKMDFLDDDANTSSEKVSDLQALSTLTQLAKLKEVDSEDDDEGLTNDDDISNNSYTSLNNTINKEDDKNSTASFINREKPDESNASLHKEEIRYQSDNDTGKNNESSRRTLSEQSEPSRKRLRTEVKYSENDDEGDEEVEDNEEDNQVNDFHKVDKSETDENYGSTIIENMNRNSKDSINHGEIVDDSKIDDQVSEAKQHIKEDEDKHNDEDLHDDEENDEGEDDDQDQDEEKVVDVGDDVDLNEKRKLAIEELISIESSFAELRDKLYRDKLDVLEHELQLCLEGSHPELSKIYYKVNGFYQDGIKLANSNLGYSLKCIDKETHATRTSIHQDFLKKLMDCKNDMITKTTSLWYKINKERNQLDQLVSDVNFCAIPSIPNYTITTPVDQTTHTAESEHTPISKKTMKQNTVVELVQQRNNYNYELGRLNGLLEFHGFPASISSSLSNEQNFSFRELLLRKATDEEIKEDLIGMGLSI